MAERKRRLSANPRKAEGKKPARKPTPLGTDPAFTLATSRGKPLTLTYWDLWLALVAAKDCGGDLNRLADQLGDSNAGPIIDLRDSERKRCHVRDLQKRLAAAGRTLEDVLAAAENVARTELRRARTRVLESAVREREWSLPMRETPRQRRLAEALRGSWPSFPVSPEPFAAKIRLRFKRTGIYSAEESFSVARQLNHFLERADKLLKLDCPAEAQALLRAWLTVVIELMEMSDDSYGCIADTFRQGFASYLDIPLATTGIAETVFFTDLLLFLIWEDYGLTWEQTEGYFGRLTRARGDECQAILRQQIKELSADDLSYQSERALTLLGQVVAEQDRFDQFESLAREMGAREWQRIIRLADRAIKKRKRPLARQVFTAAMTAGPHLDFLTRKYEQLQQGKWNPDPRA